MRPIMILLSCGCVLVGSAMGATGAAGEPAPLASGYGSGVHAYFAGDFQGSHDALTSVIEAGGGDPRPYYFRGLSALKLGRLDEAEADFQQAANLEAEGRGSVSGRAIGRALERVQGCDRLKLEQYRGRARVAALQRDRTGTRRRYSDIEPPEADVLRRRRPERIEPREPVAAPRPVAEAEEVEAVEGRPGAGRAPRREPEDATNPFANEPAAEK